MRETGFSDPHASHVQRLELRQIFDLPLKGQAFQLKGQAFQPSHYQLKGQAFQPSHYGLNHLAKSS
jgi:hypothetical protein